MSPPGYPSDPAILAARPYLLSIDRTPRGLGRYELTSFFATPNALSSFTSDTISHFSTHLPSLNAVVGLDALGFVAAASLGERLGLPIILARKRGKIALYDEDVVRTKEFRDYSVEKQGAKGLEIRRDLLKKGMKVIVVYVFMGLVSR
jgi:adenine/guanine phosphoribosyltransferase-like PRPP-binding protein